jgi:hypothetical protein
MKKSHEELKALTSILKYKLIMMIATKWNGKDFTSAEDVSVMADDIIEVISEVGNA